MKNLITLLTICLLPVLAAAQAGKAKTGEVSRISAAEAKDHINETLIVTGRVAQVTVHAKVAYLNLEQKYPQTPLSGVIFGGRSNRFGDLSKLEGRQVELKGKIEEYRNKPQIVLTHTNQLKVIPTASEKRRKD